MSVHWICDMQHVTVMIYFNIIQYALNCFLVSVVFGATRRKICVLPRQSRLRDRVLRRDFEAFQNTCRENCLAGFQP